jgi:5-(carboxyamino)imidazole ribonucleotide mutase
MVAIVMGSISDWEIMQQAEKILVQLNIPFSKDVVSAHRTPQKMFDFAQNAQSNGIKVIIAGAGGAAHLPGMIASITPLPVIGVPVKSSNSLDGWDSLLSIVQMPNGVPVATVGVNAAQNAGIIAAQILALSDAELMKKLITFKSELKEKVNQASEKLKSTI